MKVAYSSKVMLHAMKQIHVVGWDMSRKACYAIGSKITSVLVKRYKEHCAEEEAALKIGTWCSSYWAFYVGYAPCTMAFLTEDSVCIHVMGFRPGPTTMMVPSAKQEGRKVDVVITPDPFDWKRGTIRMFERDERFDVVAGSMIENVCFSTGVHDALVAVGFF